MFRGEETAELLTPRKKALTIKGLGFSVPTPPEGITAEIIVVRSFKEVSSKKDAVSLHLKYFFNRQLHICKAQIFRSRVKS